MNASCWLECDAEPGCAGRHETASALYVCPNCGGLLRVAHDLDALAQRKAPEWRALFDARRGQGVWAFREWVHPGLDVEDTVTLGEGWTPLVRVPRLGGAQLEVKQCGTSHTGSFKDLGMTVLVSQVAAMRRAGRAPRAVGCASTGDTSASLAAYCAAAGLLCVVLLPRAKVTAAQLLQPLAHGALVLALDTDFDGCMKVVRELAASGDLYLANSMNPLRIEGQKTVVFEIVQQRGWEPPDWIALPGGNLGNTAALGAGLEMLEKLAGVPRRTRLLVAQAEAANPFYRSFLTGFRDRAHIIAGATAASAIRIGAPVSMARAIRALDRCGGAVEQANEGEIAQAADEADRAGLYTDPQTACALAAVGKARAKGVIAAGERVVVVSTAHGLKFGEFKGAVVERARRPVEIPPDAGAARAAIARHR